MQNPIFTGRALTSCKSQACLPTKLTFGGIRSKYGPHVPGVIVVVTWAMGMLLQVICPSRSFPPLSFAACALILNISLDALFHM